MNVFIQKLLIISLLFCPLSALGQTGNWTDEGNYDLTWPTDHMEDKIFLIKDAKDLAAFAKTVNEGNSYSSATIKLIDNIDLSDHNWIPIGGLNANYGEFQGVFDGNQKTISNIKIDISKTLGNSSGYYQIGLFKHNNGTIKDLNINNIEIIGTGTGREYWIGGIVGLNSGSNHVIEGCSASGHINVNISVPDDHGTICIGGVCGKNETYSHIKNCTNRMPINYTPTNGGGVNIGGIAGMGSGFITGCHNEGEITGQCSAIGGIVGDAESETKLYGTIENCSNQGNIANSREASAGGIAGSGSHISCCSNSGDVSSFYKAAGIVGNMPAKYTSPITYCSNSGSISVNLGTSDNPNSSTSYCGGIVAGGGVYDISNCYNTGDLSIKPSTYSANTNTVYIGGIAATVGYVTSAGLLSNCYNTGNISVQTPNQCYAGGIIGDGGIKEVSFCYNTGKIDVKSNNNKTVIARGIFEKATGCLSLAKDKSMPFIRVIGGSDSKVHRLTTSSDKCENNYANAPMLLQIGDQISVTTENIAHNDVNGANWQDTNNTDLPISTWADDKWEKSNNTILPQLKYEDGTLMPGQPSLLKSDFPTETPSEPEQPAPPSDTALKSLSYKIGEDGKVTPIPNFSSDVYNYEIGYDEGLEGSDIKLYPSAIAANEKAEVNIENTDLPGNAVVSVTSEDGKSSSMYSIYALRKEDVGKKFYIKLYLHNLTAKINNTIYHNNDIYRGDHNENVIVELIPNEGYKVPKTFSLHSGPITVLDHPVESGGKITLPMDIHYEISASAQKDTGEEETTFIIDKLKYRLVDDKTVAVIGPDAEDNATWTVANCTIPATVAYNGKTYTVTVIDEDAFFECSKLEKVILPEGLKSIRRVAFKHCYALTSITIPASVDSIGQYAFDMDEKLTQIELKEGLKVVEEGAFDGCGFKTLTIPASVKSFSTSQDIYELEQIIVKEGNTAYASEDGILYNKAKTDLLVCPYMYPKKVCNIPKGVIRITDSAFESCEIIEEIILPEGLEVIEQGTFEYCDALKVIWFPSTIKKLEDSLFGTAYDEKDKCNVTKIHCAHKSPASIEIENGALGTIDKNNCILYVPKGCKTLYQQANVWKDFKNIIEESETSATAFTVGLLKYTVIANNEVAISGVTDKTQQGYDIKPTVEYQGKTYTVTAVGKRAFFDCTNMVRFQPGRINNMAIKTIGEDAFLGCKKLTNLLFNNELEKIEDRAFCQCSSLNNLEIPSSVTQIGEGVFDYCPKLANISVNSGNKYYTSSNGVLYNKAMTILLVCPNMRGDSYIIPRGVKRIENRAFSDCSNLKSITLNNELESIGQYAFENCTGLKSLTLPTSLKTLEMNIISGCSKTLAEIHCKKDTPIDLDRDDNSEYLFFLYGEKSDICKLYVPKGSKAAYAKALGWKDFKYILEEGENPPLIPDTSKDEIILNTDSTYTDSNGNSGNFNGMIGNGEEETTINKLTIKGSATSTTTTIIINKVTVGDGSTTTETTTSVTKNTNVIIELIGDNCLGKLVNDGIARLISQVEASLRNTVVVNNGIFIDEIGLLTRIEGAAELDITAPTDQQITQEAGVTLTASTKVNVDYNVSFIWEQLQPDGTWKAIGTPAVYTPTRSGLRAAPTTITDKLTVKPKDAGKYRCIIKNKVGDVSSTLTTQPATVTVKNTVANITPKNYRRVTINGKQLYFEITSPTEVRIINMNGIIIRNLSLPAGDTTISGLENGIYILQFKDGTKHKVRI